MGVTRVPTVVAMTFAAPPLTAQVGPASMEVSLRTPSTALTETPKNAAQLAIAHTAATQIATYAGGQADSNLKTFARGVAWEDQATTILARIILPSTGFMVQADMDGTATLKIYNLSAATYDTAITSTSSISASDVIHDSLQVDTLWTTDKVGYNFKYAYNPTGSLAFEGNNVYRFEFSFNTQNDGNVYVIAEVAVQGLLSK